MSDFQTVRRRGHQQPPSHKYADQHQTLTEMGFDSHSVTKALESAQGDLEAATAILIGEEIADSNHRDNEEYEEKVDSRASKSKAAANKDNGNRDRPKESIKDVHQKVMATYKAFKCKDTTLHDKRTCPNWHTQSDRRRNPFEYNYSCFDCPNISANGECKDGDNCPHSHTMLEKMFHPELYKISMCQRTLRGDKCDRDALCAFAHNEADLRIIPTTIGNKPAGAGDGWKLPPTRPIPHSPKLNAILEKIVILIKECGPEGSFGSDLAKKYEIRYNEKLELEDEQRNSYKFRDVVGSHANVSVVFNRGAPPKYVYDENKATTTAAPAAEDNEAQNAADNDNDVNDDNLHTIKERLVQVIKSCGTEGILGSDLPKKYYEMFGEKLDVTDEFGSKIKLKDILAAQGGVTIQMLKLQPKFLYDPTTDKPAAAAAAPSTHHNKPATGMSYSSSVNKDSGNNNNNANANAANESHAATTHTQQHTKQEKHAPASSVVVTGKSYSSVAAMLREKEKAASAAQQNKEVFQEALQPATTTAAAAAAPHHPPHHHNAAASSSTTTHQHHQKSPAIHGLPEEQSSSLLKALDESAPSAEDPIFTEKRTESHHPHHPHGSLHSILESSKPSSSGFGHESSLFQSPFGVSSYGAGDNSLLSSAAASHPASHHHHEDLLRKPESTSAASSNSQSANANANNNNSTSNSQLMGAPGLTKLHHESPSLSSLIGNAGASNSGDFHERLNVAQSQVTTLQSQINKLQSELSARNNDYEGQTLQLRTVMQRLAEAENKTNNSDEHYKLQLKTKNDELQGKQREVTKMDEEVRKIREERKNDLNTFFVNLSQIEDAITAMKCKEEVYAPEKLRQEDMQELFQFKLALKTFVANLKVHLKSKYDQVSSTHKPLEIESVSAAIPTAANAAVAPVNAGAAASRYGAPNAATSPYDQTAAYYSGINVPRADAFAYNPYAPQVVDTGLCALPGCRNQGHYTCAGCQKVSYCGAEHQR
jgi:hypothetical protein